MTAYLLYSAVKAMYKAVILLGNNTFGNNLPKTQEEVTKRQIEADIKCLASALQWLHNHMTIPDNMLDRDDLFTVRQVSYYVKQLYEYENVELQKDTCHYPVIDKVLWDYIEIQSKNHARYLDKLSAKKRRPQTIRKTIAAVSIAILITSCTNGLFVYTFGYDIIGNLADWGKSILRITKSEVISESNITLVIDGNSVVYEDIESAISSLGVDILYPSWLPDGIDITKIVYVSTDDYVGFVFNDDDVKMQIDLSEEDSKAIETNVKIGNYMCNVSTDGIYYDVIFINNFKVYYLHYTDYETLIKIIENLK